MPKRRPSPVHLGGPLGLAGVTLLASAVGLVIVGSDDRNSSHSRPEQDSPATQAATDPRPPIGTVGVEQVKPAAVSEGSSTSSSGAEVTFIVRLKGRSEVDTIARNFKRNRETADAAYADLVDDIPILKDFRLVGASYSGEINLVYQLPAGVEATRGRIEEIRQQILSIDGVAYADPDFVAHPGEDKRK
ncbi:hypothetical protein L53_08800 [Hyphomonas sp. L-53-1-40]|uniref:hypothetical protein n=1 Tax=Hyphomonas sp. L-53-1-40 TaxID=1207058 RepID=UPI0004591039|nr:hypothetical protein [Hyphomonas sp. L-53-1-40]KCZ63357.1 hypothetical protein L53_08800 [Hyphomonas sp. L-53-1-40]